MSSQGLEGVGYAIIASAVVQAVVSFVFLRSVTKMSLGDLIGATAKSGALAVASSVVPLIVVLTMPTGPDNLWLPLLIAAAGAAIGFGGAAFLLKHPLAEEMRNLIKLGWRSVFA